MSRVCSWARAFFPQEANGGAQPRWPLRQDCLARAEEQHAIEGEEAERKHSNADCGHHYDIRICVRVFAIHRHVGNQRRAAVGERVTTECLCTAWAGLRVWAHRAG